MGLWRNHFQGNKHLSESQLVDRDNTPQISAKRRNTDKNIGLSLL